MINILVGTTRHIVETCKHQKVRNIFVNGLAITKTAKGKLYIKNKQQKCKGHEIKLGNLGLQLVMGLQLL